MIGTAEKLPLKCCVVPTSMARSTFSPAGTEMIIRCVCLDWDLTDEELDEVLRRLSPALKVARISARYGR